MTEKSGPRNDGELVKLEEKLKSTPAQNDNFPQDSALDRGPTMNKTKWLACIALGFSYTTAFQQNSCTAAIVKHIDAELG
jgi:hypothetical protein